MDFTPSAAVEAKKQLSNFFFFFLSDYSFPFQNTLHGFTSHIAMNLKIK